MTLIDHSVALLFAIVYPVYAYVSYRGIKQSLLANEPGVRARDYKETAFWLWLLSLLTLYAWIYNGRELSAIGLGFTPSWQAWLCLGLAILASIFLAVQYRAVSRDQKQLQLLKEKLSGDDIAGYLPHNNQETKWFVILSVSAGICEELLFRGFLIWYFEIFSVTALAVVCSSILFGLAHAYQGWQGGVRSGATGLILALLYVFTGSLMVPIILHITVDVYSGMLGRLALSEPGPGNDPIAN